MGEKVRRPHRWWSEEFKRRVVVEATAPGASAAAIARRYDLNANLLFNWKRRYGESDRFLPVEISEPSTLGSDAGDGPTVPDVSEISRPRGLPVLQASGARSLCLAVSG